MASISKLSSQTITVYSGIHGIGSRKDLADLIGVTPATLSNWTTGDNLPSLAKACELADILGCTVDELVGRRDIQLSTPA